MNRIATAGLQSVPITTAVVSVSSLRPQSTSIMSPSSMPPTVSAPLPTQALPLNKTGKKARKEGEPETFRDRADVQSPAYSDISDDSTPVADTEVGGMFKLLLLSYFHIHISTIKHNDINKLVIKTLCHFMFHFP